MRIRRLSFAVLLCIIAALAAYATAAALYRSHNTEAANDATPDRRTEVCGEVIENAPAMEFDHVTEQPAKMTQGEYCDDLLAAMPYTGDELKAAGVSWVATVRAGTVVVSYRELTEQVRDGTKIVSTGTTDVPPGEVAARVAARK